MSQQENELQRAAQAAAKALPEGRDRDFLERVYREGLGLYQEKLRGIGFTKLGQVLDAGCGFGQWALALDTVGNAVVGVDADRARVRLAAEISGASRKSSGPSFFHASIEKLPFEEKTFDAIFSYSVVYNTNPGQSFSEFDRVLRPGGRLYVCTNGPGWYLYNLLKNHNPSSDFDPRRYAVKTFWNTIVHRVTGRKVGESIVMTPGRTRERLESLGFRDIHFLGKDNSDLQPLGFHPSTRYGMSNVFEFVAEKPEPHAL